MSVKEYGYSPKKKAKKKKAPPPVLPHPLEGLAAKLVDALVEGFDHLDHGLQDLVTALEKLVDVLDRETGATPPPDQTIQPPPPVPTT